MQPKMLSLALVTALVTRGNEEVPVDVPAHEVEVLKIVHGSANVRVVPNEFDETIEIHDDAERELLRLQGKYKRVNAPDAVMVAFPAGARDLEREAGIARVRYEGNAPAAPQASIRRHKKQPTPAELEAAAVAELQAARDAAAAAAADAELGAAIGEAPADDKPAKKAGK